MNNITEAAKLELEQTILSINNNYLDWEKVAHMTLKPIGLTNAQIWEAALFERQQGFTRQIIIGEQKYTWSVSNNMEALLQELDAGMAGGKNMLALMHEKYTHRYLVEALIEESFSSAQIAGVTITKKATKELLLKKKSPASVEEQVAANLYRALQKIIALQKEPISEALLLDLHHMLTKDSITLKGIGQYRTNNKYDVITINTEAKYKAPDAATSVSQLRELLQFINEDKQPFYIHPLIKAGILQYLFTTIRPFKDGNGRMARLLAYWYLLQQGYWATEYMSVSGVIAKLKPQYFKSYAQAQLNNNDMGYHIHYYLQAMRMAYRSLAGRLQKANKEKEESPFAKVEGINLRQAAVLQWIIDDPQKIITIRELRSGFGVSKETARTDLTALVSTGWLQFYHLNKKTYAFVKGNAFDTLLHEK